MNPNLNEPLLPGKEQQSLSEIYQEHLSNYRDLLTTKIFEKTEQIKNEYSSFARANGLNVSAVPDSLEAFDGEKLKLKLTFLKPMPDRAQMLLTVYFTSPKEFYLTIFHTPEMLPEIYPGEDVTSEDIKLVEKLHKELLSSDVFISYYDKDRITESRGEGKFNTFTEIIEELYRAPRKF